MAQAQKPTPLSASTNGRPITCTALTLVHTVSAGRTERVVLIGHGDSNASEFITYQGVTTLGITEAKETNKARRIYNVVVQAGTAADEGVSVNGGGATAAVTGEVYFFED